jgi:UDP-N-acetylmuramoylalanine--D-glutamate ligase
VGYYNDSAGTGPQTAMAAINAFNEPTTIILGGFDKGFDYSPLGKSISNRRNVDCVILIGSVSEKIRTALDEYEYSGKILALGKPKMEEIVITAANNTPKGGVVILSPAASSFDMYDSYKQRGEQFKEAVRAL